MSGFSRRLQASIADTAQPELLFGALYGRTITLDQHTLADLPTVTTSGTSRYAYEVQQAADNIRLTVQALVFAPGSSTGIPVTVGGSTPWTITGGNWAQTDPIEISVSPGQMQANLLTLWVQRNSVDQRVIQTTNYSKHQ